MREERVDESLDGVDLSVALAASACACQWSLSLHEAVGLRAALEIDELWTYLGWWAFCICSNAEPCSRTCEARIGGPVGTGAFSLER